MDFSLSLRGGEIKLPCICLYCIVSFSEVCMVLLSNKSLFRKCKENFQDIICNITDTRYKVYSMQSVLYIYKENILRHCE